MHSVQASDCSWTCNRPPIPVCRLLTDVSELQILHLLVAGKVPDERDGLEVVVLSFQRRQAHHGFIMVVKVLEDIISNHCQSTNLTTAGMTLEDICP